MQTSSPPPVDRAGFPAWTIPPALLLLCILTFGLLVPWLGLYWDDWPTLWYLHLFGPAGFREIFSLDRPALGEIFFITSQLGGTSAAAWQWLALIARWISCLAFWWALLGVWPARKLEITLVTLLFTVYPGFLQQPVAVTYSQGWITLTTFLLSYGLMAWAFRQPPRRFWLYYGASVLLAALAMFSDEYFFGLELLRPVVLWFLVGERARQPRESLKRTALYWGPFLLVIGTFLFWRLALHPNPRGEIQLFDQLRLSPFSAAIRLLATISGDVVQAGMLAWAQVFSFGKIARAGTAFLAGYVAVALVAALATVLFLRFLHKRSSGEDTSPASAQWARQAIFAGILGLLAGGWPFWVTNLPIELHFPWDRFTLAMMPGSSLLMSGLITWLFAWLIAWLSTRLGSGPGRSAARIILPVGMLVGLAAGFHLYNANLYRLEWNQQKDFFWQLTWRAPSITPGTAVLTAGLPFTYFSDNSLTAPLNWTYAPQNNSRQMSFLFYSAETRLGLGLKSFAKDLAIRQPYRTLQFDGNTSQAIAVLYRPPGCLLLLDPAIHAALPQKPDLLSGVMALSNPDRVAPASVSAKPPQEIFGKEPAHDWCYYFEKADLARQMGDWQEIPRLGEQAFMLGTRLYEVNAPELLPYLEGYAQVGDWEKAEELSGQAFELTFRMRGMLCSTWKRLEQSTPADPQRDVVIARVRDRLGCDRP